MLPLIYIVRMDVNPAYLEEFVKWYDTRHGPDLIGSGFFSCNAYHSAAGGPRICNVYEIPAAGIFASQAYVGVRAADRQLMEEVLPNISNHSNTIFRQELVAGVDSLALRPDPRPSRAAAVTAPCVSTHRFSFPETEAEQLLGAFANGYVSRLRAQPGFLRSRLLRQAEKHPLFPSSQPEWQILNEWATLSEATASGDSAADLQTVTGGMATGIEYGTATLSATLLNAETWTT
jgi:hypothetical protein